MCKATKAGTDTKFRQTRFKVSARRLRFPLNRKSKKMTEERQGLIPLDVSVLGSCASYRGISR